MKKLLTLILFLFSASTFAQVKIAPTSLEEYNYLTKGYKVQIESGLDMKKGYTLKDLGVFKKGDRTFTFKGLMRGTETKPCAILVIYNYLSQPDNYWCIPSNDAPEEMWQKTYSAYAGISDDGQNAFILSLMKFTMLISNGK